MAILILYSDSALSEATQLRQTLQPTGELRECTSWEALQEMLTQEEQAVVFFTPPVAEIGIWTHRLKQLSRTAALVALLPETTPQTPELFLAECDILQYPFSSFELLSRTATAVRFTELQSAYEATAQLDEISLLYNRGYFLKRLNEEISLSKRHLSPLSCVVLGINFYQVYADSYGHEFMTLFLQHIATLLQQEIRQEDMMARLSDDEIGLLLPRSTEKGARILTHRILQTLEKQPFRWNNYEEELSIRAGIAGYPLADEASADGDSIVRYARHALYQARCSEDQFIQLFSELELRL